VNSSIGGNNKGTGKGMGKENDSLITALPATPVPSILFHKSLQQVKRTKNRNDHSELFFYVPISSALIVVQRSKPSEQWKYFYAINQLQTAYFQYKANASNGFYAPLSARLLDRVLGWRYYRRIIRDLVNWGVFTPPKYGKVSEIDGQIVREKNSYALREPHRSKTIKLLFHCPNRALKAKEAKDKQLQAIFKNHPNLEHVYNTMQNTTIDSQAAMQLIDDLENATKHQIDCYRRSVEKIDIQDFYLFVGKKTSRAFNNVSNLWSDLRSYLRIEGEKVSEYDIANSQPLLASTLYPEGSKERQRYLDVVLNGDFYRTIEAMSSQKYANYKKLKKAFFKQVFFGCNSDGTRRPLLRAFKSLFPELLAIIEGMKENEKNALAIRLQNEEAQLVIGKVVGRLRDASIPCLTIHDSVLCKVSDGEIVKRILSEELHKLIGFKCTIKEKKPSELHAA
jgi:hypothetical protein